MSTGFKNCYFDKFHKKILLKEQHDNVWRKYDYQPWCYISDTEGNSNITDIYKRPMMKFQFKDIETINGFKNNPDIIVAESDLKPEVKFMHERYDKEQLEVDINDWNICIFDIEVAGSSKYYDEQLIEIRNLDKTKFDKVELFDFDTKYDKNAYEVFDIENNAWVKFTNSCFASYEFPAPEIADWPINLITCYSTKTKQTYTWGLKPYTDDPADAPNYVYCKDEITLMKSWLKWFNKQNFDIISGWNSVSYDIPYIINRCAKLRTILNVNTEWERALSPLGKLPVSKELSDRKLEGVDLGSSYDIPGLYSIDYMEVYKTFGKHGTMPSYSLNYVSSTELNDTKLEYDGSINETYKYDWNNFTKYNIKDVMLIVRMENKNKLFPLIIQYAFECIVTLDKIYNKIPTTTGYILKFLHNTNRVLNDKEKTENDWWAEEECYKVKQPDGSYYYQNTEFEDDNPEFKKYLILYDYLKNNNIDNIKEQILSIWKPKSINGIKKTAIEVFKNDFEEFKKWPHPFEKFNVKAGFCYDYPGRYNDCMSFDITSSYPHHIMQFKISKELVVKHPTKEQIESGEVIPSDVAEIGFLNRDDGILPNLVKQVFDERAHYKKLMKEAHKAGDYDAENRYDALQSTSKVIINSMYGVCLAPTFHLYSIECARSITRCARVTLRDWLTKYLNEYYESKTIIKDIEKYFSEIKLTANDKEYTFNWFDEITVLRNNNEIKINACDFNPETDLLGID